MLAACPEPAVVVNSSAFQATNIVLPANTISIPARSGRQLDQIWRLHCLFSPNLEMLGGVVMTILVLVEWIRTEL